MNGRRMPFGFTALHDFSVAPSKHDPMIQAAHVLAGAIGTYCTRRALGKSVPAELTKLVAPTLIGGLLVADLQLVDVIVTPEFLKIVHADALKTIVKAA
jgi:hypothetical protein